MKKIKHILITAFLVVVQHPNLENNVISFEKLTPMYQLELIKVVPYTAINELRCFNDTVLIAAMLSTECKSCSIKEQMLIAQTAIDRANDKSFRKRFGLTIFDQIFADAQYSGSKNSLYGDKTGRNFKFDIEHPEYGEKSVQLYQVAQKVLKGERIVKKVRYFANPKISTDTVFINWLMEKPINLWFPTKHKFRA